MLDHPSPTDLKRCRRGAEWAAAVSAAAEVGLFDAIGEAGDEVSRLARRLELDPRALSIVLVVLEALGLVRLDGGRVELTDEGTARYADPQSGVYEGLAARRWRDGLKAWLRLDEVLRAGGPLGPGGAAGGRLDPESLPRFIEAMASKPPGQVQRLVDGSLRRAPHARTVLDLGGGPGVHSRAFVARGLIATLADTPETIEYVADAYQLRDDPGIELHGGDFLESLPAGRYDIVLLSNITHIYDAETNRRLIERIAQLQEPGGLLTIMDFVLGLSPFAPLFAITMLLNTETGNTHSVDDYREWLERSGYGAMEVESLDEDRQLITALRIP